MFRIRDVLIIFLLRSSQIIFCQRRGGFFYIYPLIYEFLMLDLVLERSIRRNCYDKDILNGLSLSSKRWSNKNMMCTLDEFEFRFLVHNVATVQLSTPWSLLIIKADLLFTEIKSGKITRPGVPSRPNMQNIKVEQITH